MANDQQNKQEYEPPKVCTKCGTKMEIKDGLIRCPYCEIDPNEFSKPNPSGNPSGRRT